MSEQATDKVADYFANRPRPGMVLTREILQHGAHMINEKRGPKCLLCYPTITKN